MAETTRSEKYAQEGYEFYRTWILRTYGPDVAAEVSRAWQEDWRNRHSFLRRHKREEQTDAD